ncbi:hypothetical protein SSX86_012575 [Deinandra increscens subsp. villosa]|uniref:Uncharacterized protein n=1 Tax=Deinandra increscens subsp. villosa TaxID=3103831 RepID=A0AAP0H0R9_9ASTR
MIVVKIRAAKRSKVEEGIAERMKTTQTTSEGGIRKSGRIALKRSFSTFTNDPSNPVRIYDSDEEPSEAAVEEVYVEVGMEKTASEVAADKMLSAGVKKISNGWTKSQVKKSVAEAYMKHNKNIASDVGGKVEKKPP